MLRGLLDKITSMSQSAKDRSAYRAKLLAAVEDGRLTDQEVRELEQDRMAYGISLDEIQALRVTAYKRAFQIAAQDRRLSSDELADLKRIREVLGLRDDDIKETTDEFTRLRLLAEIQEGNLPQVDVSGLVLKKGEAAHWAEPAQLLEERVLRRRYEGGSRGTTIRVMKGVSFRVGVQRGQVVTDTAHVPVSSGQFVITNQRIVFKGDKKSFNYRLNQVLGVQFYSDGLSVADESGRNRVLRFSTPGNSEVVGSVFARAINSLAT